ncbi:MAG: pyridoxamine 5'-phosphate oxidase family protein [Chloroflexi bacterium]|nr:pyridoxamine 5'-phosphate oxidase family protein [Chloroflexota bacterium]MCI0794616.1 pyridoxamine 5'-phosphate oxidase family protein [Chloroflexota bacterium]
MIELTEEMQRAINNARNNGNPCILATASPEGLPNAGFRGTIMALDGQSLAYRERGDRSTLEHLRDNPKVVVLFRDAAQELGWKFRCTATVYRDGSTYQQVMAKLAELGLVEDPQAEGVAVVLQVDQITTLFGEIVQEREPNLRW